MNMENVVKILVEIMKIFSVAGIIISIGSLIFCELIDQFSSRYKIIKKSSNLENTIKNKKIIKNKIYTSDSLYINNDNINNVNENLIRPINIKYKKLNYSNKDKNLNLTKKNALKNII